MSNLYWLSEEQRLMLKISSATLDAFLPGEFEGVSVTPFTCTAFGRPCKTPPSHHLVDDAQGRVFPARNGVYAATSGITSAAIFSPVSRSALARSYVV
jgi:hypothetical protein